MSEVLLFGRSADSDPIGSNFNKFGGKGLEGPPQGQVTMDAFYDASNGLAKAYRSDATSIFRSTSPEDMGIEYNEYVFTMKHKKTDQIEVEGQVNVLSSFCNEHKELAVLFPNDWEMQKQALLNDKLFLGVARQHVPFANRNQIQGLTVMVQGLHYRLATTNIPPGCCLFLDLDSPNIPRNLKTSDPYTGRDKVVAQLKPYLPTTYSKRVAAHVRNYFMSPVNWTKGMNKLYRTTDAWMNFNETLKEFILMNFLMMMHTLMENGVGTFSFTAGSAFDLRRDPTNANPNNKDVILGLAKAFGLLENTNGTLDDMVVTEIHKKIWSELTNEMMLTIFCADRFADFGFGWDPATQTNEGIDNQNSTIKTYDMIGKLFHRQLTTPNMFFNGLSETIQRDNDLKRGKSNSSTPQGNTFQVVE